MRRPFTIKPFSLQVKIPLLLVHLFWERYGVNVTLTSPDHLHTWLFWIGFPMQSVGFADAFGVRKRRFCYYTRLF